MLNEWLDADRVSIALIVGIACLAVAAVVALRLIRKVVVAVLITLVLLGAAAALAVQWSGLRGCQQTCTCEFFGRQVSVPSNPLCGPDRIDPSRINLDINIDTGHPSGVYPENLLPENLLPVYLLPVY